MLFNYHLGWRTLFITVLFALPYGSASGAPTDEQKRQCTSLVQKMSRIITDARAKGIADSLYETAYKHNATSVADRVTNRMLWMAAESDDITKKELEGSAYGYCISIL